MFQGVGRAAIAALALSGAAMLAIAAAPRTTRVAIVGHKVVPNATLSTISLYGRVPLSFELNEGQTDEHVKFISRRPGYDALSHAVGSGPCASQGGQRSPDRDADRKARRTARAGRNTSVARQVGWREPSREDRRPRATAGQGQLFHRQRSEKMAHEHPDLRAGPLSRCLSGD